MKLRRNGLKVRLSRIVLMPAVVASLAVPGTAQPRASGEPAFEAQKAADAEQLIGSLRKVSGELTGAANLFQKHLDDAIVKFDHGYRTDGGKRNQGADADLVAAADIVHTAVRKAMTARILTASQPGDSSPLLGDVERILALISEARKELEAGDTLTRRLLLVSVQELDSREQAEWKEKHDQLRKARTAAEEAAKKALAALPVDLPELDPAQQTRKQAWDALAIGNLAPHEPRTEGRPNSPQEKSQSPEDPPPIHLEPHKRSTLINERGYRMALTDSGTEDHAGRHIFYQEEWVQRGMVVLRMRRRVGVDTKTSQHILIKRYRPREYHGEIEDLYKSDRDYLWSLEPLEELAEPSRQELESAWDQVALAREQIQAAVHDFQNAIRKSLVRNESALDAGLPDELREKLFAIRGHLAGAEPVLEAETKVRDAIEQAAESFKKLEPLAAWANRVIPDQSLSTTISASEWESLQERSDNEIASTQAVSREARGLLPPDIRDASAKFPPFQKDVVVRMFRRHAWNNSTTEVRHLQEIWHLETGGGKRRVRRTAALISIDLETGSQKVVAAETRYYPAGPDETVDEIFDQYGAQDLPLEASLP
jgi:hypothetical protein